MLSKLKKLFIVEKEEEEKLPVVVDFNNTFIGQAVWDYDEMLDARVLTIHFILNGVQVEEKVTIDQEPGHIDLDSVADLYAQVVAVALSKQIINVTSQSKDLVSQETH